MSAQSGLASRPFRRVFASGMVILSLMTTLLLTSCTREQVASAMAAVVVELQATLEPLSATVEAGGLLSGRPTVASPDATVPPVPSQTLVLVEVTSEVPTLPPPPTSTPQPSPTPRPSATPELTATPLPSEIELGGSVMVLVPGGFFKMGADAAEILAECNTFRPGCDAGWFAASEPAHTVLVAPFYIDQFEVTNLDYLAFLNAHATDSAICGEQSCVDPAQSQLQPADA
jgi:formylglycine-generating enzyme required for sulfatase activity